MLYYLASRKPTSLSRTEMVSLLLLIVNIIIINNSVINAMTEIPQRRTDALFKKGFFIQHNHRHHHHKQFDNKNKENNGNNALLIPRGGGTDKVYITRNKKVLLAKIFSILSSVDGICGIFFPRSSMLLAGIDIVDNSLSNKYVHGIGVSALTAFIATFIALSSDDPNIQKAIGYALLVRFISMTLMMITNTEMKLGMSLPVFGIFWVSLACTIYNLFTNSWGDPLTLTKICSLILGMHGLLLFVNPEFFLRKTAIAIGPDPLAKDMASIDGGYMFMSSLVIGLLANGLDPVKVCGYAALSMSPVLTRLPIQKDKLFGIPTFYVFFLIGFWMVVTFMYTVYF